MDICDRNRLLAKEVGDFLLNLPNAGEEWITDYLVWKWREMDTRFKTFDARTFSRFEESNTTGADFALDL